MRLAVVFNPVAARTEAEELRRALSDRSLSAKWLETSESDAGVSQARAAVEGGAEVVISCAGDGTVRACAEGMVGSGVALAVMPAGTGNLLARNLGVPEKAEQVVEAAVSGTRRRLDVGKVNGEIFTVMAGTGLDAAMMEDTDGEAKDRLGVLAYVIEGAKHLFDEPFPASIRSNRGDAQQGTFALILVGNLGRLQGGVDLFPDASPEDGRLELLGLLARGAGDTVVGMVQAAANSDSDHLFRATGPRFDIELPEDMPYELDGEAREATGHLEFEVVPSGLVVCAPEGRP